MGTTGSHHCLLNRLFRRRSKKTWKLRVTGLCAGNSPMAGEFLAQMASNAENISIWWRHHAKMTKYINQANFYTIAKWAMFFRRYFQIFFYWKRHLVIRFPWVLNDNSSSFVWVMDLSQWRPSSANLSIRVQLSMNLLCLSVGNSELGISNYTEMCSNVPVTSICLYQNRISHVHGLPWVDVVGGVLRKILTGVCDLGFRNHTLGYGDRGWLLRKMGQNQSLDNRKCHQINHFCHLL